MYVCPDCKSLLAGLTCQKCAVTFDTKNGVPILLSRNPKFAMAAQLSATYDEIYSNRTGVWEDQGRTPEFIRYFSGLVAAGGTPEKLLEVGCGEGFLLATLPAGNKVAIDISSKAAEKAGARANAKCCVAVAESLPFPDDTFNVVVSVGVMEHFIDDHLATADIRRVLKPGGRYIALIHIERDARERLMQKVREYLYPSFRPLALLRWLTTKVYKPIHQPIQIPYTAASGKLCLEKAGLTVDKVISRTSDPSVPLVGPHVVIYVAHK